MSLESKKVPASEGLRLVSYMTEAVCTGTAEHVHIKRRQRRCIAYPNHPPAPALVNTRGPDDVGQSHRGQARMSSFQQRNTQTGRRISTEPLIDGTLCESKRCVSGRVDPGCGKMDIPRGQIYA